MKAVLCKTYGPPDQLSLEEIPSPTPAAGEVLIDVAACGVNYPDTLIIQGKYQFKPEPPFSPGGEVAGVIRQIGEGVDGLTTGQRVVALMGWGGFAEQVVASARSVVPLPDGVDLALASGFLLTYSTTYYALKDRARMQPGETLLVLGAAGGVGLAAVELGKQMGARVIAAASSADKLALCRRYGADETIDYRSEDLKERVKVLTDGRGADVVYDPVGGDYAEPALRATGWNGRYLVIGFAAGTIPRIPLNLTLLKGNAIVGVFWGEFTRREPEAHQRNLAELLSWLQQGKLKPHISARYPLARAADALNDLLARKATGKLVLLTETADVL